jgi:hypothetical protein
MGSGKYLMRLAFLLAMTVGGGIFVYMQQWLKYALSNND